MIGGVSFQIELCRTSRAGVATRLAERNEHFGFAASRSASNVVQRTGMVRLPVSIETPRSFYRRGAEGRTESENGKGKTEKNESPGNLAKQVFLGRGASVKAGASSRTPRVISRRLRREP